MSHVSERFTEGYPGTLLAQIAFEVTCDNTIKIEMRCTTSEPTIVNMSNCPYFNLAGHVSILVNFLKVLPFAMDSVDFTSTISKVDAVPP